MLDGFDFHVLWDERQFPVAFGAFAVVFLDDFVWWFEFVALIQHIPAALTNNFLWHSPTLPEQHKNSITATYL